MKHKYETGGKVKISGKWYELEYQSDTRWHIKGKGWLNKAWLDDFVEAYEPPQPDAYEWVKSVGDQVDRSFAWMQQHDSLRDRINLFLTETYGDPTVHTYNGEEPEEFGLKPKGLILVWAGFMWISLRYADLEHCDQWRKQPPPPTE